MQAYSELYEAAFADNMRLLYDADSLEKQISKKPNVVDIAILHYSYNVLNDTVIWQKLYFDQDSVIRENTSITTSLYSEQTAFLVSPLKEYVDDLLVTFNFNDLFIFYNTHNPILQLFVDFDNGNTL